ncbi:MULTISPECIES: alcohol dehydrogenase catalytic domain-containing protein [unclassified Erwinia]|uniref:zinc-binding dehydrogenase n=1 Tax=unclassified Erwinia TaxID=2622719 RepID=UPI0006F6214E|nr:MULTISPECIES: alcohol dehydrogenase catalytic domain-containing protein [unclassified Erwinia]KQN54347.1 galactitol-1-phosphate 5-dehydrogenase [Erwinia sp. Leaf53]PLV54045.1 galactitol-1-phosphate 5-dehydrogenase [Erwinia sp. B116]
MKSVVIHAGGSVTVEERPLPQIETADEVRVEVLCSGLCGSDIPRIFHQGAHFYPITLGHEFCGRVTATGPDVSDLAVGDLVACVPLQPCFECDECRRQLWSQCRHYRFIGSRSDGGNREVIVLPRRNLFALPPGTSPLAGAFFEPLTVSLHTLELAGGCRNKAVIVVGAGTIGLLAMQAAKALGARSVTAIDLNPERLALAQRLGADRVFNSAEMDAAAIRQALEERRFDQLILETAGAPQTVALSIEIAGPQAQIGLIGTLHRDLALSSATFGLILRKELRLLGSWMNYSGDWPGVEWQQAAQLFAAGEIDLTALIAVQGGPEVYAAAVSELQGGPMSGKIMLDFSPQQAGEA